MRSISGRYYRAYWYKIQSYEDLYQTVWYLFLYALDIHDPAKGNLASHLKRTIEYKLNAMMRGERAPKSGEYPFTFLRMDTREIPSD